MKAHDLVGKTFGLLTVTKRIENSAAGKTRWRTKCECGGTNDVVGAALINGEVSSCGCKLRLRGADCVNFRHGQAHKTRTYRIWCAMRARCRNPNVPHYKIYGGRGISVCKRWDKFENFWADMGDAPDGRSLDRIDNDGNYTPKNCRWATPIEQSANSRVPRRLTFNGLTLNLTEWAHKLGIDESSLHERLSGGWPISEALSCGKSHRFARRKLA